MNRVKVWVFTLLVVALGFVVVRAETVARRTEAVAALDARLAGAASHVTASVKDRSREATTAAALVARDRGLVAALSSQEIGTASPSATKGRARSAQPREASVDEKQLGEVARTALSTAQRQLGLEMPPDTVVTAGNRESLARKGEGGAEDEGEALLRGAIAGDPRSGFVQVGGGLWYGAAAPVGDGAGVVVLVPLDAAWARSLAAATGADVTFSAPKVKPVSTAPAAEVAQLQRVTKLAGAGDVGSPGTIDASLGPIRIPKLPQPIPGGAPIRARAIPFEGVKNAFAIVSLHAARLLDPAAAFFWRAVAGLALVLIAGLLLGLFVSAREGPPQVPEQLYAAAARIESGDFAARAPSLAGKLGTVAAALNRAAEIAGPAQASRGSGPTLATGEWYQLAPRSAQPEPALVPPEPHAAIPAAASAAPEGPTLAAATPADLPGSMVSAAFAEPSATAAAASSAPSPVAVPASRAAPAAAAVPAPGADPGADEEAHWREVFDEFLRTRASCGEAAEGLTYERFRQKLEANRTQLVAKYACRTVRFQVYVKDGKTALKATPVK